MRRPPNSLPASHCVAYDAVKCATAAGKLDERYEPSHTHSSSALSVSLSLSLYPSLSGCALWLSLFALARWANTKWANWQTQSGKQTLLWVIVKCSTHAHTAHTHTCTVECTHTHAARGWLSERIELKRLLVCNRFLSSRCSLQLKLFASPIDTSARPPLHPLLSPPPGLAILLHFVCRIMCY